MRLFPKVSDVSAALLTSSISKNLASALVAACLLTPSAAKADRVMIEAVGDIVFVNEYLGNAFTNGDIGQMVLIYDTDAVDQNPDPKIGEYSKNAIIFFQITDSKGNPYHTFDENTGGTITVTNKGATGDGFDVSINSGANYNEAPNDGVSGPAKNKLPFLSTHLRLTKSLNDVYQNDSLTANFGDDDSWDDKNVWFELRYCSSCGAGGGFARGVNFQITDVDMDENLNSIDFKPGPYKDGKAFFLNGEIDPSSLVVFSRIEKQNPTLKTMVLQRIPGSNDDDTNLKMSLKIHKSGFKTVVPPGGMIASGGVDLFLSGTRRVLEKGACVGVHSWSGPNNQEGAKLPKDDPEHEKYLKYFRDIGIQEAFYWFTLQAAPSSGIYWMTQAEATKYAITTEPVPLLGTKAECDPL